MQAGKARPQPFPARKPGSLRTCQLAIMPNRVPSQDPLHRPFPGPD